MYRPVSSLAIRPPCGMGNIDFSTFNWEDWLLIGVGGMMIYSAIEPDSALFSPSKKRKRKKGSGGFLPGAISAGLLLGGGYLAYQYFTTQQQSGGSLF